MPDRARLAVWASGNGSTLQNLIDRSVAGTLDAEIVAAISDIATARALDRARHAGIAAYHVSWKGRPVEEASEEAFGHCRTANANLVVLAGFLKRIFVPSDFADRIINVHPSLIPAFSGQGCFGHHVHESAIARGVTVSGCTVHFCDNEYDHGPIILQRVVDVFDDDTPSTLADRVQQAEREALPEAINQIVAGRVWMEGGRVRRRPSSPRLSE
jgi:formyltetrahydrofolate-dependent phosphoribosylglycinamide formyltransferase